MIVLCVLCYQCICVCHSMCMCMCNNACLCAMSLVIDRRPMHPSPYVRNTTSCVDPSASICMVAPSLCRCKFPLSSVHGSGGRTPSTAAARSTAIHGCQLRRESRRANSKHGCSSLDINSKLFSCGGGESASTARARRQSTDVLRRDHRHPRRAMFSGLPRGIR